MALYRHILSIWLNQQQIIKHKAGGWRKNLVCHLFFPFISSIVGRHMPRSSSHCKQRENIWWGHWYKIDGGGWREGRAGRFVSNRFGQNVSPISRFASVWLPLAKLGEQRNSMNMLSPGIGGMGVWVWGAPEQPTAAISMHQNTWH